MDQEAYRIVDTIPITTADGRRYSVEIRLNVRRCRVRLLSEAHRATRNHTRRRQLAGGLLTFHATELTAKEEQECESPSSPPSPSPSSTADTSGSGKG